jgi:asparagine synthase (glutamine-hydrolysing)
MARAIAFRGPDSLQQTHQAGASFAFSLLKTGPGPQAINQPCTLDGETWFLGDARCDGREEVTRKLAEHGVKVSASAGSEQLVLHYWELFGASGLAELDGDFSFVLWTPKQRRLVAFRDLTGARPFFYAHREGVLLFSNTLQAVLFAPGVSRELDEEFLADFLLGSPYQQRSASVYRGIRRLPPGHFLEFSERSLSTHRIANMPVENLLVLKREEEFIEEFRRLLEQAVRDRLPSVDTTILLSGGLDSTSIAARAIALRQAEPYREQPKLQALSVDFQPLFDDRETDLATRFATKLGIPCQVFHLGDSLPFAGWKEFPALLPEPPIDPYSVLSLSHSRRIALTSRVGFSGMGCDELLRLQALPYLRFLVQQGKPLAAVSVVALYILSQKKLPPLGAGIRSGFLGLFRKKAGDQFYPPWFAPDFERRLNLQERWRAINIPPPPSHPFNSKAYLAVNDLSVGSILESCDATWTGCHMELRAPFMDRRLARFVLKIPPVPWAMDKHLLRRSQVGILSDEIRLRPKTPVLKDVLLLHVRSGRFNPGQTPPPSGIVKSLIHWPLLINILQQSLDQSLYLHLRPLALARWLENVEANDSVRYIS